MDGRTDGQTYGRTDRRTDGRTDGRTDRRADDHRRSPHRALSLCFLYKERFRHFEEGNSNTSWSSAWIV